jgi:hypothetical protein
MSSIGSTISRSTAGSPLPDAVERPVPNHDAPNPWGFHITPNPRMRAIDALAMAMAHTPLGWPGYRPIVSHRHLLHAAFDELEVR